MFLLVQSSGFEPIYFGSNQSRTFVFRKWFEAIFLASKQKFWKVNFDSSTICLLLMGLRGSKCLSTFQDKLEEKGGTLLELL
ncbi:hypothetical protein SLEP1_g33433 [Rubroshorea leprosula]|uniref:Uncharacterized protein n=1 Tax=Rubroshorea leprosula TaxID=152421 RepID=A0AAV5KGR4_9ROSI|nr:hypothetical protein SLEP1_g33433 [Rubroshorea leprosula]